MKSFQNTEFTSDRFERTASCLLDEEGVWRFEEGGSKGFKDYDMERDLCALCLKISL